MRELFDGLDHMRDFASTGEMSANWLLGQMFPEAKSELKITEADDEMVAEFLRRLHGSRLFMPSGEHSLVWLDARLRMRLEQAEGQRTEAWERVRTRLRYVLAKVSVALSQMAPGELEPPPDAGQDDGGGLTVETK